MSRTILKLRKLGGTFDLDFLKKKISDLEKKTFDQNFWNNDRSKDILKELNSRKKILEEYEKINSMNEDVIMLIEFVEMGDTSYTNELEEKIIEKSDEIDKLYDEADEKFEKVQEKFKEICMEELEKIKEESK